PPHPSPLGAPGAPPDGLWLGRVGESVELEDLLTADRLRHRTQWAGPGLSTRLQRDGGQPLLPAQAGDPLPVPGSQRRQADDRRLRDQQRDKEHRGCPCVAVKENLYEAGKLEEQTTDWYTQDTTGNVWYFGEATRELNAQGKTTSTEGSWQAGI